MEMDEKQLTALVVNTVREAISAKNSEDELEALKTKNAELEKELADAKGKNNEGEEEKKKEDEEGVTLENAKPSQAMVSAFATACNVDFGAKTPSFSVLASLVGIDEKDPVKRIAAVNTKFAELSSKKTTEEKSTVEVF